MRRRVGYDMYGTSAFSDAKSDAKEAGTDNINKRTLKSLAIISCICTIMSESPVDYSTLFTLPPKDHKLTLDQLYQWHSVHSPKAPTFIYPDENRDNKNVRS